MRIIIAGAGEVGSHLAKMLSQEKHDIILIDPDEEKLKQLSASLDVMTRSGSSTSISLLIDCDIRRVDLLIAVATSEETNITTSILGKKLGAKKTIARIDNQEYLFPKYVDYFTSLGVDYMIYPEKIASREVVGLLEQTGSTDLVSFDGGKLTLFAIKLEEDAPIINKTLLETAKKLKNQDYRAVAITRSGKTIIPRGDDFFLANDIIYVISNQEGIRDLMEYSGKEQIDINNIMILGGSRIGMLTAKEIGNHHNVKLIELDREKSYRLSNYLNNTLVINGDGRDMNLLIEEGLKNMDAFIAVTGDSETNILSSVLANRLGVKKTIAEVENIDYIALAENMGIDTIINKKIITASRIFRFTTSESVSSVKCLTGTEAEVMEYIAKPDSKIVKAPLNQMGFPKDSIIGGIIRQNNSFIANGYTIVQPGDRVVVFALPSAINKVGKFFN
ncbi:MAG: Trk system potassium transporter TrkA [Bacteroidales bacterium]|nr:Trk system potassium transporter TrkA [Bacteroidales bacterium]